MKKKFKAVQENDGNGPLTGWTVKFEVDREWYTVCDTWCSEIGNAKETAEKIAALLNQSENKPK